MRLDDFSPADYRELPRVFCVPGYEGGRHSAEWYLSLSRDEIVFRVTVLPRGWTDRGTFTPPRMVSGTYRFSLKDPESRGLAAAILRAHHGEVPR